MKISHSTLHASHNQSPPSSPLDLCKNWTESEHSKPISLIFLSIVRYSNVIIKPGQIQITQPNEMKQKDRQFQTRAGQCIHAVSQKSKAKIFRSRMVQGNLFLLVANSILCNCFANRMLFSNFLPRQINHKMDLIVFRNHFEIGGRLHQLKMIIGQNQFCSVAIQLMQFYPPCEDPCIKLTRKLL